MKRYVDGVDKPGFFQKEAGSYFPEWIERVTVKSSRRLSTSSDLAGYGGHRAKLSKEDGVVHYAVVNNEASLVYLANQLVVEFHIWLSKIKNLDYPDRLIFDLDPSGKNFSDVRKAALTLKKLLEALGLTPFAMVTGSKGLHVVCPLKADTNFVAVRNFAHEIAQIMVEHDPKHLTLEMRKDKREGKIFVDYLRNSFSATAICPYSTRPLPGASVATPVAWSEVAKGKLKPNQFTIHTIFKRLKSKKDPWKEMEKHAKSINQAWKKLDIFLKEERLLSI